MAKAFLRYNVSSEPQRVIITWAENSSPGAEVGRWLLDNSATHEKDGSHTVDPINPVMHIFKWYRSSDGTTLDTLLFSADIDASIYNVLSVTSYEYVVDRGLSTDPVSGTITLRDARLLNQTYSVWSRGIGPRLSDEYIIRNDTIGGFDLKDGEKFVKDDRWIVTVYSTVQQQVTTPSTANAFRDVALISTGVNQNFDATNYNKLLIANFAGVAGQFNFGALALIPNYTTCTINTHGGNQNYLRIQFNGAETFNFYGVNKNFIDLAKGETIRFFFKDGVCRLVAYDGNANRRGSVHGGFNDYAATLRALEATGVLLGADYTGLYEWIKSLPAGVAIPLANWADPVTINTGLLNQATVYPNKSRYGIDTLAGTFRVPHLASLSRRFLQLSGTDLTRIGASGTADVAGGYQHDRTGRFNATMTATHGYSYTGSPNAVVFGNGQNNPSPQASPIIMDTSNLETTIKNFGEIPLIIL